MIRRVRAELANLLAWRAMPVSRSDLVLDVGSGDNPHIRADVLCDASVRDAGERRGGYELIVDGRPFLYADACSIPVRDKAFDFVICRHLLEHMERPERLIDELMRVGKAGYVETPSALMERLYGWDFHVLLVDGGDEGLIIRRKGSDQEYGILPRDVVKSPHWEDLYNAFEDTFAVRYFWTGQIRYRVEDPAGSGDYAKARAYVLDPDLRIPPRSMRRQARWLVNRTMRLFASSARPDMGRLLKCPECDGGFTIEPDAARCGACGKLVEILEGHVFSFIGGR